MEIEFRCECGKSMKCKAELAGRRARCNGCGKGFAIPVGTIIARDFSEIESIIRPQSNPIPEPIKRATPHEHVIPSGAPIQPSNRSEIPLHQAATTTTTSERRLIILGGLSVCSAVLGISLVGWLAVRGQPGRERSAPIAKGIPPQDRGRGIPAPVVAEDDAHPIAIPTAILDSKNLPIRVNRCSLDGVMLSIVYFEIVNASDESIEIANVLYNGDYEPEIKKASFTANGIVKTWIVGLPKHGAYSAFNFEHDINFIDVYTNSGSFRFNPNGTLFGRVIGQPGVDTKRLTQLEDAKIAARADAIVDARKALFETGDVSNPLLKKYANSLETQFGRPQSFDGAAASRAFRDRLLQGRVSGDQPPPGGPAGKP